MDGKIKQDNRVGATEARHIRSLLSRSDSQRELNGIAFRLRLVTAAADADTVRRRLHQYVATTGDSDGLRHTGDNDNA